MAALKSIKSPADTAAARLRTAGALAEADRVDLAAQLIDRAQKIGRALSAMGDSAFDDPAESSPEALYMIVTRELGFRINDLASAARFLLEDTQYSAGTAWEVLHGRA